MIKAPQDYTPEQMVQKAAEAGLKVSDISKKERKRLIALRELSMMDQDANRIFKTEAEKQAEYEQSMKDNKEPIERKVIVSKSNTDL